MLISKAPVTQKVALIGLGAIGRFVLERLAYNARGITVAGALVRPEKVAESRTILPNNIPAVGSAIELAAIKPNLVVECAGHAAVHQYGEAILSEGIDLAVVSIGAMADAELRGRLVAAAQSSGAQLILPAGAIAGVDALAAARRDGLARVTYRSRKPPLAWKGTYAETVCDIASIRDATVLFEGNAEEAARLYPQNANVAATVALAGLGFEATRVRLVADPRAAGNVHLIDAEGAFGRFTITLFGRPLPDNPKTSTLAALSILRTIENRAAAVVI
ncbi:MAG TPA: aspartate dehydrogenase [Alphaproteobacteria bacterium]|nr:aspartate dehydrogenase [Alphaproteobacteria bacterium]